MAQVRTDYTKFLDNGQSKFWRLETADAQNSTLHDTPDTTTGPAWARSTVRILTFLH